MAKTETAKDDFLVQYVVCRKDLLQPPYSWAVGSVITQGCHASVKAIWSFREDETCLEYLSSLDTMRKVVLAAKDEAELLKVEQGLQTGGISFVTWVEHPENIKTALATKPYPRSIISPFLKKLALFR